MPKNIQNDKNISVDEWISQDEKTQYIIPKKLIFPNDVFTLSFHANDYDDFELITDGKRLQQVLINFLTNAEKYTSHGEIHVHCSLSETPGMITFSVSDTGPGVPADKADMIFERFCKLDSFKQGTGLGLNICQVIAERLGGKVKYDQDYTLGARFVFIHPLDLGKDADR